VLRVLDADSGRVVWSVTADPRASLVPAFAPDGRVLATVNRNESLVQLWDAGTGDELLRQPVPRSDGNPSEAPAFSPDGRLLAVTHQRGVSVWEWRQAAEPRLI